MNRVRCIVVLMGCVLMTGTLPAQSAEVINVADHGIVPGADVTLAVTRLIQSVRGRDGVTLQFPAGQYDFFPDDAEESYRAVANHDNGLKRFGFPIFGCENLTIDGGSATFLFHGRMVPITVEQSKGVTLRNFTIDWVRSFHAEMTVVESDAERKQFVVDVDPEKYPFQISDHKILFERFGQMDPIGSNIVFDPQTKAPIHATKRYLVNSKKAKVTSISKTRFRFDSGVKVPPPVGSVLVAYGVHPTSRLCPAIHVTNSSDISIQDVVVHDAGGMGLIVERTENVLLDHMVVTSGEDRIAATRADATHFIGCKGTIQIENCLFEHMLDDGINVHGAYVKVDEYLGDNQFLCEISHFQQWGLTFAEPGDKVALLSRETILPFAETTVTEVTPLNDRRFLMTVDDVPAAVSDGSASSIPMSFENLTWYPNVTVRKNRIRDHRARGILVTTKGKVLIEENVFSSQMHGILIEGDNNKWYESGAVADVTIRNNIFENTGYSVNQCFPLMASPLLTENQRWGDRQYHRNIRFTGNTIRSFNGLVASAASVDGLHIAENKVLLQNDYPRADEGPSVVLEFCNEVTIENNQAIGFEKPLDTMAWQDTTKLSVISNTGFDSKVPAVDVIGDGVSYSVSNRVSNSGRQVGKPSNGHAKRSPNIVLFFVDDLGWNDLGYRNSKFETPNIDQLAQESLDFQRAYIASPTCSPSRATLLTGQHPAQLKMVRHIPSDPKHGFDSFGRTDQEFHQWQGDPAQFPCRNWLPTEHITYAEALKELGYYNQFIGKWHLGHEPFHPVKQGFDAQFGTTNFGHPKSYNAPFFKNTDVLNGIRDAHLTDTLTDEAVRFISQYDRDQPFMLSMWFYGVHRPPVGREDLVEYFLEKGYENSEAIYAAQVKAVDESVGRIRGVLNEAKIDQETVIVFLSDQGSWYQNLPLRGNKRVDTLCEGGARVPMLIRWPGVTASTGMVSKELVQSTDLYPTLVEIAGGSPESHKNLDGVSLVPMLRGAESLERGRPLFGYRAYQDLYASVREGDWKMLAYRSGKVSLYNVPSDVGETRDVAEQHPEIIRDLTEKLIQWEKEMDVQQYSGVQ